jgi:chromosome partitioning protein
MERAKIIAVANHKGGTGKTTTTYNLGSALAAEGKKVLLADNDPQSNLTTAFGADIPEGAMTLDKILNLLADGRELPPRDDYILRGEGIDLIPSCLNLSAAEINLRNEPGGEYTLSSLLETLREEYGYILIDTNPSLGMLTINALAACDSVIIPVSPQLWSATGLTALLDIIMKVKRKINPRITVSGILITMTAEYTLLYREATELVNEYFGGRIGIFDAKIPQSVNVGRANFYSRSIAEFDAKNKAAVAYAALAKEVIKNGGNS